MRADDWKWFANGFEWLAEHASGWQFGEQGMLVALVEKVAEWCDFEKICMEIGAGDGKSLPLTLEPFVKAGWHLHAYEMDADNRASLGEVLLQYKAFSMHGAFDDESIIPSKASLIVIDVDSIDEYIMTKVLKNCSPEVLMVEHYDIAGPHMTGASDFHKQVPKWLCGMPLFNNFRIQARYERLDDIAGYNGYMPVARTRVNSIYIREDVDV